MVLSLLLLACTTTTEPAIEEPAPTEAGPRHTTIEIVEAARTLEPAMDVCDRRFGPFTLVPPKWYAGRSAWFLGCLIEGDLVICFAVDDKTLEVTPMMSDEHDSESCDPYAIHNEAPN